MTYRTYALLPAGHNFLVQMKRGPFLRRIWPEMQTIELFDYLHFVLCHAFALSEVVCPRRNYNLYLEAVRSGQILLQMPAVCTVSEVDQSSLAR